MDWDLSEDLRLSWLAAYSENYIYTRQDYNRYTPSTNFNTTPNPVNAVPIPAAAYAAVYANLFPGGVVNDPQNGPYNRFTTSDISWGKSTQWSHEVRLQSNFDGPLNFNVGGNLLSFTGTGDYYVMFNTGTAWYQVQNFLQTGNPNCVDFAPCISIDPKEDPDRIGHNYYDNYAPYSLKSSAVFGELYWQMAESFKWTLGLRYTIDKKTVQNHAVTLGTPGFGVGPPPGDSDPFLKVEFKETTGRFGFDWKPDLGFTDDSLVYAFFSRGYKAGGLNPACSAVVSCPPESFEPEFVNAIEIGMKNTLLDGRMTLNGTFFNYDYEGYQVSKIVNRTSINENIDAKIHGVEVESVWQPLDGLRLNAAIGWLETKIDGGTSIDIFNRTQSDPNLVAVKSSEASACVVSMAAAQTALAISNATNNPFALLGVCTPASTAGAGTVFNNAVAVGTNAFGGLVADGVALDLDGNELPNAPNWTISLGAEYTWLFGNDWAATLRGDYYKQTKTFARIYNSEADRIDAWDNLNFTLTIANPRLGWEIGAFVKNATDEEAITDFYLTDDSSGRFRNTFYTEPRTYGVSLQKRF